MGIAWKVSIPSLIFEMLFGEKHSQFGPSSAASRSPDSCVMLAGTTRYPLSVDIVVCQLSPSPWGGWQFLVATNHRVVGSFRLKERSGRQLEDRIWNRKLIVDFSKTYLRKQQRYHTVAFSKTAVIIMSMIPASSSPLSQQHRTLIKSNSICRGLSVSNSCCDISRAMQSASTHKIGSKVSSNCLRRDRDERWRIIRHKLDAQRATTNRQVVHRQRGFLVYSPKRMKFCEIQNFCSRTAYMGISTFLMCVHVECHFQAANRLYQNA